MSVRRTLPAAIALALWLTGSPAVLAQPVSQDPPDRVVRLAFQSGDVEYAAAGADSWSEVDVNRPLIAGDYVETGDDGRAALDLGGASARVGRQSMVGILDLDSQVAQFEVTQGALDLRVRRMDADQSYEVDTPTLAFVADRPGRYRVEIAADGGTIVTVYSGSGVAYGQDGVSSAISSGRSFVFRDARFERVYSRALPAPDDLYRFAAQRDDRFQRSLSRRYVSPDVIGYDDLDAYGEWHVSPDYGAVWYPMQVARNWAPYHDGHWAWVDPWGWTWVDNAPWGFAPSHYGRWAYVDNRWGWIPGPPVQHAVYAPALVAFVGGGLSVNVGAGGGEPVGWFALGPRDVYRPPYQVTNNYVTRVNVTNAKVINATVINNVYRNNAPAPAMYANRNVPGAVTVVPRAVFAGARPVAAAAITVRPDMLAHASIVPMLKVAPSVESIGARPAPHPAGARPLPASAHPAVIARHAPPPPPAPIAERVKVIERQGGTPLAPAQMRAAGQAHAKQVPAQQVIVASPNPAHPAKTVQPQGPEPGLAGHPSASASADARASASPALPQERRPARTPNPPASASEPMASPAGSMPVAAHAPNPHSEPAQRSGLPGLASHAHDERTASPARDRTQMGQHEPVAPVPASGIAAPRGAPTRQPPASSPHDANGQPPRREARQPAETPPLQPKPVAAPGASSEPPQPAAAPRTQSQPAASSRQPAPREPRQTVNAPPPQPQPHPEPRPPAATAASQPPDVPANAPHPQPRPVNESASQRAEQKHQAEKAAEEKKKKQELDAQQH